MGHGVTEPAGWMVRRLDRAQGLARVEDLVTLDGAMVGELGEAYSHEAWGRGHFLRELPGKWALSHLVEDAQGTVVGFWIASTSRSDAHTHRVAVAKTHRRSGVARALFAAVRGAAAELGCGRLTLTVGRSNDGAARFYEALGFERLCGAALATFAEGRARRGTLTAADELEEITDGTVHRYHAWAAPITPVLAAPRERACD